MSTNYFNGVYWMDYQKSIDCYIGLRDLTIVYFARELDKETSGILCIERNQIKIVEQDIFFNNQIIKNVPRYVFDYLIERDRLFSLSTILFPTIEGTLYSRQKFSGRFRAMTREAGIKIKYLTPRKLSDQQWLLLVERNRFSLQRVQYQQCLIGALIGFLGFRPCEVVKLKKKDIDLGNMYFTLRDTKSQEDQIVPIPLFLQIPLQNYVAYLGDNDYLFVNTNGGNKSRLNINLELKSYAKSIGMRSQVSPRKFRATVGKTLAMKEIPLPVISRLLRHKDPATTLRNYTFAEDEEVRDILDKIYPDCGD